MSYTSGSHTVFHHRYHIVWITKYRYKVLEGDVVDFLAGCGRAAEGIRWVYATRKTTSSPMRL
jgi:Transposase IS200 like